MAEMTKEELQEQKEALRNEAKQLGIEVKGNPSIDTLQKMVEDFYEKESATADIVEVKKDSTDGSKEQNEDPRVAALKVIKEQERANKETRIVKITMVDKREASTATHAYFSTGNIAMNIPLDTWVEMPKILILQAEESKALTHVEAGDTTLPKLQKRYVVEYRN